MWYLRARVLCCMPVLGLHRPANKHVAAGELRIRVLVVLGDDSLVLLNHGTVAWRREEYLGSAYSVRACERVVLSFPFGPFRSMSAAAVLHRGGAT